MTAARLSALFAAVFAVAYTIAFEWHWELFSYHPRLGEFGWGQQPSRGGPVMHWYGSLATGLVAALVASLVAWPLARRREVPASLFGPWLGWAVPLVCIAAWFWFLRLFFLR